MVVDSCNAYSSSTDCFRGALFPNHLDGIVFSSVDPHDIHWSVPPVAQASPAPNSPLIIPIQDRVGQGGVWNAFSSGGDVLKVIRIERDNDDDYAASYHAGLRNHVGAEISCLTTLAGTDFVPRLKGVWASATAEEEYWAVLTSYAGEAVAPNDNAARWLPSWIKCVIHVPNTDETGSRSSMLMRNSMPMVSYMATPRPHTGGSRAPTLRSVSSTLVTARRCRGYLWKNKRACCAWRLVTFVGCLTSLRVTGSHTHILCMMKRGRISYEEAALSSDSQRPMLF